MSEGWTYDKALEVASQERGKGKRTYMHRFTDGSWYVTTQDQEGKIEKRTKEEEEE